MRKTSIVATLLICSILTGCQRPARTDPHRPTIYGPAATLVGRPIDQIAVQAPAALSDAPLTAMSIRRVAEQAKPAVVAIQTRRTILGLVQTASLGSGFFIHPSGLILTNNHIVKDAAAVAVMTYDRTEYTAAVLARHPAHDLALLKIDADQEFPVIPMGDSDNIQLGDLAIAIGHPLGLGFTVTLGLITMRRELPKALADKSDKAPETPYIQTDATLHRGSSGGPLLTLDGAWVGINMGGLRDARRINFAIPAGRVREFLHAVSQPDHTDLNRTE